MRLLVINGPNLNLLGKRQPEVYGTLSLEQIEARLARRAGELGVDLSPLQANDEGVIVDFLQREAEGADGVIINPGALTHYGLSLRDALEATHLPIVEVHISNIYSREEFRRHSVIADIALGQITGLGWRGYIAALETLVRMLREKDE
ncbi:MAG: type II 3-dehydroquinate dehydratase [Dehalococcoidia bacterium]